MGSKDSGLNVDLRSESREALESVSIRLHTFAEILGWILFPAFILHIFGIPLFAFAPSLALKVVFPIIILYHLALGVLLYYGYTIVRWSFQVLRESRSSENYPIKYEDSNFETVYSVERANLNAFLEGGTALLLFMGLIVCELLWLFTDISSELLPDRIPLLTAVQIIDAIFNTQLASLVEHLELGTLLVFLLLIPVLGCYFVCLANVRDILERTRKQNTAGFTSLWRHRAREALNSGRLIFYLSRNLINRDANLFWSLFVAVVKILVVLLIFMGFTNVLFTQ